MYLGFGQADAIVFHKKRGRRSVHQFEADFRAEIWFDDLSSGNCIDRVLHEFADVNLRTAVQVAGQQFDHTAKIYLKVLTIRHKCLLLCA